MREIHVQLDEADAIAAYRLFWSVALRRRYLHVVLPILIVVLTWVYGTGRGIGPGRSAVLMAEIAAVLIACVGLIALIAYFIVVPRRARRGFRQNYMLREPMVLTPDDHALHIVQASARGQRPWSSFTAWAENRLVLMLLSTDQLFFWIPKRVLDASELTAIRANLARAGIPRARGLVRDGRTR
jgi:hypothetical protein